MGADAASPERDWGSVSCFIEEIRRHQLVLVGAQGAVCESKFSRSLASGGKKRTKMSGSVYPFDKLHNDRMHGTLNVMVMIGCE